MLRLGVISTANLFGTPRANIGRMQSELVRLNTEVVTGRMADVGLNLGSGTAQSVSLHIDLTALDTLASSNETMAARLTGTQAALDHMRGDGESLLTLLVQAKTTNSPATLIQAAQNALDTFVGTANTSDGRNYLFGGINTSVQPIATDGAPEAAIDAAFLAKFGFVPGDAAAAGIDAATMTDFLDNEFADLFGDPEWGTTWSSADDKALSARLSPSETLTSSVSANETAMRKLAQVYSMVARLGMDGMSTATRGAIIDKATEVLGDAIDGVIVLQTGVGEMQNRVKAAGERLTAQQSILETRIGTLEGVDPAEAKVKIDTLGTQIEMSYSLTAKLLQMSLLNYV